MPSLPFSDTRQTGSSHCARQVLAEAPWGGTGAREPWGAGGEYRCSLLPGTRWVWSSRRSWGAAWAPAGATQGSDGGSRITSSGDTGGAASGSWAPFIPGGPWLHFVSNDKLAVDWPPSSRGNRIHDILAVGVNLGAAGFGARRAGRGGDSLGTQRNQGHTLISAQRRGAASSHEVHEETLGCLGGITVGKEGLPAPQPRVFTPGPSRGQRRSCPQSPGWPLETLVQRRLPPPRGQAGWRPSALTCFLLSRRDDGDGGRVLGGSSAP